MFGLGRGIGLVSVFLFTLLCCLHGGVSTRALYALLSGKLRLVFWAQAVGTLQHSLAGFQKPAGAPSPTSRQALHPSSANPRAAIQLCTKVLQCQCSPLLGQHCSGAHNTPCYGDSLEFKALTLDYKKVLQSSASSGAFYRAAKSSASLATGLANRA